MTAGQGGAGDWPWPAPVDDGAAAHLVPGIRLPSVLLPATTGQPVDLSKHPGRAVLFVYPWAGRPGVPNPAGWDDIPGAHGSTAEAEGFAVLAPQFANKACAVFGLSGQALSEQQELAGRLRLPFPLVCDAEDAFATALRLPRFEAGAVPYLKRLTLVVNDGQIERTIFPVHPPDTHAARVLELLPARAP